MRHWEEDLSAERKPTLDVSVLSVILQQLSGFPRCLLNARCIKGFAAFAIYLPSIAFFTLVDQFIFSLDAGLS